MIQMDYSSVALGARIDQQGMAPWLVADSARSVNIIGESYLPAERWVTPATPIHSRVGQTETPLKWDLGEVTLYLANKSMYAKRKVFTYTWALEGLEAGDWSKEAKRRSSYFDYLGSYFKVKRLMHRNSVAENLAAIARQYPGVVELGSIVYEDSQLVSFLLKPMERFGGRSAIELLRSGEERRVLSALASDFEWLS